jgi:hypothetical protein
MTGNVVYRLPLSRPDLPTADSPRPNQSENSGSWEN